MPLAWRFLPPREADWVLCSSHAFAHRARFGGEARDAPTYVYAHTPARYVWDPDLDTRGRGLLARSVAQMLRPSDRRSAQRHASIAANSGFVAERIERAWRREARVIYPPIDVERFLDQPRLSDEDEEALAGIPDEFILGASRFVPYKRLEAAVDVGAVTGVTVVLAGEGPHRSALEEYARHSDARVLFVADPSTSLLSALYRRAMVYVFAPVEDFGIMPVEAMAAGTPVLVNSVGGAAESVVHGVTGAHVADWTREGIEEAVDLVRGVRSEDCQSRAREFDRAAFDSAVRAWIPEGKK